MLRAISLVYDAGEPTWLLLAREEPEVMAELIAAVSPLLGDRLYVHAAPVLEQALRAAGWSLEGRSRHLKMVLTDASAARGRAPEGAVRLGPEDADELLGFYARAYPGNWFDPRMLATRRYVGLKREGDLVAVAGVHVWSPRQGVAALGNIATAPRLRGQGLGTAITAAVCAGLLDEVETIGLNVAADNAPAIACYRRLGFTVVADYLEGFVVR